MNNLTETQKEAMSSLVNLTEEFCNRELSQKAERLKELFPEAFAEPKQERKKIVVEVSYVIGDYNDLRIKTIENCLTSTEWKVCDERKIKVKELPELYTAEDMAEFANNWKGYTDTITKYSVESFMKSKSTKSDERKEPFYALGVEFPNSNDDFGFELKRKPTIAK